MIGGMMFLGYMLMTNMGSVMAMLPGGGGQNIQVIDDDDEGSDYEDYVDQLDCNEDGSRCKWCDDVPDPEDCNETIEVCGSAVESKDDSESRVAKRAKKKWDTKSERYYNRCHMVGNPVSSNLPVINNQIVKTVPKSQSSNDFPDPPKFKPGLTFAQKQAQLKAQQKGRATPSSKPTRCSITATDCARANRNPKCKLVYKGSRCMCDCPKASLGLTLFKHSFHPSNIPRAYLTNKSRSGMNLHLNYA